jgi:hypothetical protein
MRLKFETDTIDDVSEQYRDLYEPSEAGGYRLTVDGAVSKDKLTEFRTNNIALAKERDRLAKALADNDPTRVEEIVAKRTEELKQRLHKSLIEKTVTQLASEAGVVPAAIDDVVQRAAKQFTITDDGQLRAVGADGEGQYDDNAQPLQPAAWLNSLKATHPHYFPASSGGGAPGSRDIPRREARQIKAKEDFATAAEKSDFIRENGFAAFEALPLRRMKRLQDVRTKADLRGDPKLASDYIAKHGMARFLELPTK